MPDLIFSSNKIRLNLAITFVMSRNKHISKKTPCFSCKRSKNIAKPNKFERRILKLNCYACTDNPKCWRAFSMFRNASSQNEFRFNTIIKVARLAMSMTDSLYNEICCRPWSAESRTENFISIGHSVAEILNVKVREINNFGNNFHFIFLIFVKVQLPIWRLIIYA